MALKPLFSQPVLYSSFIPVDVLAASSAMVYTHAEQPKKQECPSCQFGCSTKAVYCSNCGGRIVAEEKKKETKPVGKIIGVRRIMGVA